MGALTLTLEQVSAPGGLTHDIHLSCAVENSRDRGAQILAYEFELWLLENRVGGTARYLTRLAPDFLSSMPAEMSPGARKPLPLLWHVTARDLQLVESARAGADAQLQLRGHFNVLSSWSGGEARSAAWEPAVARDGSVPVPLTIPQSQWIGLMKQIGFTHLMLVELGLPALPASMACSRDYLLQGWQQYREGNHGAAMASCGQALECLTNSLYETHGMSRRTLLEKLMQGAEPRKREQLGAIWTALGDFFGGARAEGHRQVSVKPRDAEMALMTASALVQYLARWVEN